MSTFLRDALHRAADLVADALEQAASEEANAFLRMLRTTELRRAGPVRRRSRRTARIAPHDSVIYFLRSGDAVKVGTTTDLQSRLASLRGSSPIEATLMHSMPGGRMVERELHERYRDIRLHLEWFRAEPRLLDHIDQLRRGAP